MNQRRPNEPRTLWVLLTNYDGSEVQLMNDGVLTVKQVLDGGTDDKQVLQSRAAFRGFVGTMTELMGYSIKEAWDDTAFEVEGGVE